MNKSWFAKVKSENRLAYAHCLEYFQSQEQKDWKVSMRNPDQLVQYFKHFGFEITTFKYHRGNRYRYRFSIVGPISIQSKYLYRSTTEVKWFALSYAFYLLNRKLVHLEERTQLAVRDMDLRKAEQKGRNHGVGR